VLANVVHCRANSGALLPFGAGCALVCTVTAKGQDAFGRSEIRLDENIEEQAGGTAQIPEVEAPAQSEEEERPGRLRRALRHITWKRVTLAIVIAGMIPALLGLFYRLEFVRPVSTLMLARWVTFQSVDRQWVKLDEIAPLMVYSVIMSEDGQFCAHRGVDLKELNAVIENALDGEKTRGASTIPMQTAKNLFLWTGRSYVRKALEIPLAVYIDGIWPKDRIMEVYLNIAEFDAGVFGVEAAAQHYFNRPASRLTARQAALLTVSLPDPKGRNPAKPTGSLQRLAGVIQRRAAKSGGYIQCVKQATG
jgi:monofunctional glycosyltransferase